MNIMATLKIISLYVRGLADQTKHCNLFHYLHKCQADILLQETNSTPADGSLWSTEWGEIIHFGYYDG